MDNIILIVQSASTAMIPYFAVVLFIRPSHQQNIKLIMIKQLNLFCPILTPPPATIVAKGFFINYSDSNIIS